MSAIETMVASGFELEAASALGLAVEPAAAGFVVRWQSPVAGDCAARVASKAALVAWVRAHWRLFAGR